MLRTCIIICLLFVCGAGSAAPASTWQQANTFYQQKLYDSAATCYGHIVATRPHDAIVYYNLGNTYYRLNKIGLAILNYKKALNINPGYKDAADNLALTETRISNKIPTVSDIFFVKWWNRVIAGNNTTMWSVMSLLVFLVIIGLGLLKQFRKGSITFMPQVNGILIVLLLCFLTLAYVSADNQLRNNTGVVMQNDAPLMNDQHTGKAQNLLPEGTAITILDEKAGWMRVRLPDGRTGWLQDALVNKI